MFKFLDVNGHHIQFVFEPDSFLEQAEHVLVICKYETKWLLTFHKKRGFEFPGGKREEGESLEEAARREVHEETGAILDNLIPIGSYKIMFTNGFFVKKVYLGIVNHIEKKEHYLETNGPVLVQESKLLPERFQPYYSFIMQDQIIEICLKKISESYNPAWK